MNKVLSLTGFLGMKKHPATPAKLSLRKNVLTAEHLKQLLDQIDEVNQYFQGQSVIDGYLIKAVMYRVIPKSQRLDALLTFGRQKANDLIRGVAFKGSGVSQRHVFTYFLTKDQFLTLRQRISLVLEVVVNEFGGVLTDASLPRMEHQAERRGISKTAMVKWAIDCSVVAGFSYENDIEGVAQQSIVSLYRTSRSAKDILLGLGLSLNDDAFLNESTVVLGEHEIEVLSAKAPFLISMAVENIAEWLPNTKESGAGEEKADLPDHHYEPIIGVIDTFFDRSAYFRSYVDYHPLIKELDERASIEDKLHGTAVSSIIVDGPSLNPDLDDGCGRFRVRHFGISGRESIPVSFLIRKLRTILEENSDIKVWNLSLGDFKEAPANHVSYLAAEIDELEQRYNVIFVIAGTNLKGAGPMRIGSPADSINSLVVNSVKRDGTPASYSRCGPVLSFFVKPDVSYYGGDHDEPIVVAGPGLTRKVSGTSFAAPWIARKVAFLIYRLNMSREAAKALIIHASAGWKAPERRDYVGYGVVPVKIADLLSTPNKEIRFIVTGVSRTYETHSYALPVPIKDNKYPYRARATLAYFPRCHIEQGVDYTDCELDIHLGRVMNTAGKIKSINDNQQDEPGCYTTEGKARREQRKWDNVKNITQVDGPNYRPCMVYDSPYWGFSIKRKNRLDSVVGNVSVPFALVVTLECLDRVNRYDDFVSSLEAGGSFHVQKLDYELTTNAMIEETEELKLDD